VPKTKEGLSFRVRVESTTSLFLGLPFVGFTTRRPTSEANNCPQLSKCLAESIVVGGCGEAFARDKSTHYVMGFRKPPETEIQSWSLQPDLPSHEREPPAEVKPGDGIECRYTWGGRIQFLVNDSMVLDFDTGRPLNEDTNFYAVVDVCFSAASLTLMPDSQATPKAHFKASGQASSMSTLPPCDSNSRGSCGSCISSYGYLERQSSTSSSSSGSSSSDSESCPDDLGEEALDLGHPDGIDSVDNNRPPSADAIVLRALHVGMFGVGLAGCRC